jgi:hypothetical protein
MSTKVFNAFLLRDPSNLWPLLRDIRHRGEQAAKKRIDYLADGICSSLSAGSAEYVQAQKEGPELCDWEIRESITWSTLDDGYKQATVSTHRSAYDFDLSISVRENQGQIYLIAHEGDGMRNTIVPLLLEHPELVEYHYQNSTDRPDEIPENEWEERAQAWDQMAAPDRWWDYLLLEIVCWGNWWRIRTQLDRMKRKHREDQYGASERQ